MLRHSGFGVRHEDNDDQQCTYFHSCGLVIMTFFYVQETTDDDLRENRRVGRASFIVYVSSVQDRIARKQTESIM